MELRHLKYFVTVAEELNFSRASARLRVSQPAVSRQIKDLEDEVGTPLFVREPSGLKLTAAGETFLAHARDILRRSSDSLQAMQAFGRASAESVVLGYIPTALPSFLTKTLREFSAGNPKTMVHLRELSPHEQIDALREGGLDLAFIGNPCPELKREFSITVIKRLPLAIAVPDNHLLALRKTVELKEFSREEFIGLAEDKFPGRNEFICETCQAAGFTPRMTWKADSLSSMLALVGAGRGVALLPEEVKDLPHPGARFVSLKRCAARVEWAVAARKQQSSKAVTEMLKLLQTR